MAQNKLILRKLKSPYLGSFSDTTKGSVLSHTELDGNQIYLKGEIIHSATTVGGNLILQKINGNDLVIDISANLTATTLDNLIDVIASSPSDGDLLVYNGGFWQNFDEVEDVIVPTINGQTFFDDVLSRTPIDNTKTKFFLNGVRQRYGIDYTISGNIDINWVNGTVTLNTLDEIIINYY